MNQIVRSKTDRMIGGVCGGIAHVLRIDPVFVRLFCSVGNWRDRRPAVPGALARHSGGSAPAQMNFWGAGTGYGRGIPPADFQSHPHTALYVGGALILLGAYYLRVPLIFPGRNDPAIPANLAFLLIVAGIVRSCG